MASLWYHAPANEPVMEAGHTAEHWVLQLLAEFSVWQVTVEVAVASTIALSTPALSKIVEGKYLSRLRDEERWALVRALANDVGYGQDLSMAARTMRVAMAVRNHFAHGSDALLVREPGGSEYFYLRTPGTKKDVPDPLTPAIVRQLSVDCRWLQWLVRHLMSEAGVQVASPLVTVDSNGDPSMTLVRVDAPPALPISPDWDPTALIHDVSQDPRTG